MSDIVYWIWFQLLFGIGTRRAELLMNHFQHPREIHGGLEANGRVAGMLTEKEAEGSAVAMEQAKNLLRRTEKKGCAVITPDHEDYPPLLREVYSRPAALYVKGDLSCLRDKLVIAMVGSRKHTDYGKKAGESIAGGLSRNNTVVVSGLAHGIDTICHHAALRAGGKTVGILGCGIDVDYPKGSAELKRAVCENGAVMTEYPLGTEPYPSHFPVRNRIIAGMSHGVVVVEADSQSGSLITARLGQEEGREVFAVPGSIFAAREQGTHALIKDGAAKLVENAGDILVEYLHLNLLGKQINGVETEQDKEKRHPEYSQIEMEHNEQPTAKAPKPLPPGITDGAREVYGYVNQRVQSVQELTEQASLDVAAVQAALTELEIYGLVQGYPGRRFGPLS